MLLKMYAAEHTMCRSNHCRYTAMNIEMTILFIYLVRTFVRCRLLRVKYGKTLPACLELVLVVVQRIH